VVLFEIADQPLVPIHQSGRARFRQADGQRLTCTVGKHGICCPVGAFGKQAIALCQRQVTRSDGWFQRDLKVHLAVGGGYACGVVDEVGVDPTAVQCVFDTRPLRESEVSTLTDHSTAQFVGIHPDRIVRGIGGL
jgi:hypothetical protein